MTVENLSIRMKQIHFVRWALIVILLNFLLFMFVIVPDQSRIAKLQSEYSSLRADGIKKKQEIRGLQERFVRLQQGEKDLQRMYHHILLPRKGGVMDIRLEFESIARELNIQRQGISYRYFDYPDLRLQQFQVAVPVEGTYRNIRLLINKIERSPHFLILDRLELSSQQQDILTLNFQFSTYLVEDEI